LSTARTAVPGCVQSPASVSCRSAQTPVRSQTPRGQSRGRNDRCRVLLAAVRSVGYATCGVGRCHVHRRRSGPRRWVWRTTQSRKRGRGSIPACAGETLDSWFFCGIIAPSSNPLNCSPHESRTTEGRAGLGNFTLLDITLPFYSMGLLWVSRLKRKPHKKAVPEIRWRLRTALSRLFCTEQRRSRANPSFRLTTKEREKRPPPYRGYGIRGR